MGSPWLPSTFQAESLVPVLYFEPLKPSRCDQSWQRTGEDAERVLTSGTSEGRGRGGITVFALATGRAGEDRREGCQDREGEVDQHREGGQWRFRGGRQPAPMDELFHSERAAPRLLDPSSKHLHRASPRSKARPPVLEQAVGGGRGTTSI